METSGICPRTPAELVAVLTSIVPEARLEGALKWALTTQQTACRAWDEQRLRYVEQGWGDAWQEQQTKQTALVTELTRVLAERFGC